MIVLNTQERTEYTRIILPHIYRAKPGTVIFFRDFFPSRTASPRLARYLYEELRRNTSPLRGIVRLNGTRMREGLIRL